MEQNVLDSKIAAMRHPKVTADEIVTRIVARQFIRIPGTTVTICHVQLENGFSVRGESACVDVRNYNQEVGEELAYRDAFRKLWELEGYLLAERLHRSGNPALTTAAVARVAHEVNRAYCAALGDNSQAAWEDAPQWQKDSALLGVELHAANPEAGPQGSHESWLAQKLKDGWKHGPVKNAEIKEHPCMVPFDELPRDQQAKDYIFRAVVHALK